MLLAVIASFKDNQQLHEQCQYMQTILLPELVPIFLLFNNIRKEKLNRLSQQKHCKYSS